MNVEDDSITYMKDDEEATIRINKESDLYAEIKKTFDNGTNLTS